jgi:hypothetical protein
MCVPRVPGLRTKVNSILVPHELKSLQLVRGGGRNSAQAYAEHSLQPAMSCLHGDLSPTAYHPLRLTIRTALDAAGSPRGGNAAPRVEIGQRKTRCKTTQRDTSTRAQIKATVRVVVANSESFSISGAPFSPRGAHHGPILSMTIQPELARCTA